MQVLKPMVDELGQEIPQEGRCNEKATGYNGSLQKSRS